MTIAEGLTTPLTNARSSSGGRWADERTRRTSLALAADRMSIVCCVDDVLASRVSTSLPCVQRVHRPSDLLGTITRDHVDIVIADPMVAGVDGPNALIQIRRTFPSVLVVLFTRLHGQAVQQLVRLAGHGIDEVILLHFDDTPTRFVELADRRRVDPLSTLTLDALAENLDRLPASVRSAIVSMFRGTELVRTTAELAEISGVTKRTLYRHLSRAEINAPRRLVAAGRVMRAVAMLRDPGRSVREIVTRFKYSRDERFAEHLMDVTGMRVKEVRGYEDLEGLARIVAARVCLAEGVAV